MSTLRTSRFPLRLFFPLLVLLLLPMTAWADWTHPTGLSDNISPDGENAVAPMVAMAGTGNAAIITWRQRDGASYQAFVSQRAGETWTHPADLSDNISPDGFFVSTAIYPAISDAGDALLTWSQSDGMRLQVFKAEHRSGSWTLPEDEDDSVTAPYGESGAYPGAAMDAEGNALLVWQSSYNSWGQIYLASSAGGAWTFPDDLADNLSGSIRDDHCQRAQAALSDNGDAVVVWRREMGSDAVWMIERREGSWSTPTCLTVDSKGGQTPVVAMDDNGDTVVAWLQSDGSTNQIYLSHYHNGAWTHPLNLSDAISVEGVSATVPTLDMDGNGNAVVAWLQSDGSSNRVLASFLRDGAWTHPANMEAAISPAGGNAESPLGVALSDSGDGIIVWSQSDGDNQRILLSERRDGAWTHPASASDGISLAGTDARLPKAAMDDAGNAIVIWQQSDGSNTQVFKSEYAVPTDDGGEGGGESGGGETGTGGTEGTGTGGGTNTGSGGGTQQVPATDFAGLLLLALLLGGGAVLARGRRA